MANVLTGIGRYIDRLLGRQSRPAELAVAREPQEAPAVEMPSRPRLRRMSRPWGNAWDVLGWGLSHLVGNPDNLSIEDYRQMATQDETVKGCLKYSSLSIMANFGPYKNPNKKGQRFIEELLDRCRVSISDWGMEANTAEWAGYSVTEKVLEYEGGKIWAVDLPVIDPALRFVMETDPNARHYGQVRGIVQDLGMFAAAGLEMLEIPADKLILHANDSFFGNPYGQSECKSFYHNFVAKKAMFLQWSRTLEKYGTPSVWANAQGLNNPEGSLEYGDTTQVTKADNILYMLSKLGEDAVGVLPDDIQPHFLEARTALGEDFEKHQNHCNKCIMRGLLLPALLFEPTDIGSFALGEKHFQIFMASTMHKTRKLQRSLLRYLIAPLLRWNFGPNMPVGEFAKPQMQKDELQALSAIFFSLTNAGYMTPSARADSDFVRDKVGLEPLSDEDLAKAKPAKSGENMPAGEAGDGARGTDQGQPSATPQAPGRPQGRAAERKVA